MRLVPGLDFVGKVNVGRAVVTQAMAHLHHVVGVVLSFERGEVIEEFLGDWKTW